MSERTAPSLAKLDELLPLVKALPDSPAHRSLLDETERSAPQSLAREPVSEQLVEEIARLGRRMLEVAATMAPFITRSRPKIPVTTNQEATSPGL